MLNPILSILINLILPILILLSVSVASSRVIEETTATNNTAATYVYGNYIDEVLSMNRNSNNYYYHSDDIYNVMMLTNAAGGMAEDYVYDAFGVPDDVSSVGNPYMFNGREYDVESGLYNYRTRYLDPSVGRFTTRDTIGIWGDPSNLGNEYTYVANSPMTYVDPYGYSIYSDFGFGKPREIHLNETEVDILINGAQTGVIIGSAFIPVIGPYIAGGLFVYDAYDTFNNGDVIGYVFLGVEVTPIGRLIPDSAKDKCGELLNYLRRNTDNITVPNALSNSDDIVKTGNEIVPYWPPNGGFDIVGKGNLLPGVRLDRYGPDSGSYVSPIHTPFGARSLPQSYLSQPLTSYETVLPIPVKVGPVKSWFGQPGKALSDNPQFQLLDPITENPSSVHDLVITGHLRELK